MTREVWITGGGCVSGEGGEPVPPSALSAVDELLPDKHARHIDRAGALAVAAAARGVAQAGWDTADDAVGLAFGVDYGTYPANFAHQRRVFEEGPRFASPAEFTVTLPNMTAAFVALAFGWRGPSHTVADGGVSVASALGTALDWIRDGTAERVCVGTTEPRDPAIARWFDEGPLARDPARPELGAVLCCESADAARARGASPLAVLSGYGAASSAADAVAEAWSDARRPASPPDVPPPSHPGELCNALPIHTAPTCFLFVGVPVQARAVVLEPAT